MIVLRYMDDKTCKTCERTMDIDIFDEGLKTCKMCLPDYQIKEPIITNTNINDMRFKEKDVKKMRNIEK